MYDSKGHMLKLRSSNHDLQINAYYANHDPLSVLNAESLLQL